VKLFLGFSVMNGGQHRFRSDGIYNIGDTCSQAKYKGIANLKMRRLGEGGSAGRFRIGAAVAK
jgi:hypothetical protein